MSWYNYVDCFLAGAFSPAFGGPLSDSVRQTTRTRIVVGGLKICPPRRVFWVLSLNFYTKILAL